MKFGKLHGYHRHRGHQGQHNLHHRLLSLAVSILSGRASSPVVRYYGLYANAHRRKVKKASLDPLALRMVEEEIRRIPAKGWRP
jgi:hypothetical protein